MLIKCQKRTSEHKW